MDSPLLPPFEEPISQLVWDQRYRFVDAAGRAEEDLSATLDRVAHALASPEGPLALEHERHFREAMEGFRFVPGGRVLAGAGTGRRVTLFNCFVMGSIEDSMEGIFRALQEAAVTMQQGGGVGCDFSTLRPAGTRARSSGRRASGPVSFMALWDQSCRTLASTWPRRGAMMATLRCDHPDIEAFVAAKRDPDALTCFNLSVQVTDLFMQAVAADEEWPLVFPEPHASGDRLLRAWPGYERLVPCRVLRRVSARELWRQITRAAAANGEPGVLFVDTINRVNNLAYRETISATNPCGEAPLPPYGACDLGSLNLAAFVSRPFTPAARLDLAAVASVTQTAVRMLDNVTDISAYPLPAQAEQALGSRRIGIGVMGLADALLMLGLAYESEAARKHAGEAMRAIRDAAYRASIDLAREKGSFPFLDRARYLRTPFIEALPSDIRRELRASGIRNSHLTAVAPTGSISLLANNVSSGIEPIFASRLTRRIQGPDGGQVAREVVDYACRRWSRVGEAGTLPPAFASAQSVPARAHLAMQAALQPYVDQAIAKTVNLAPVAAEGESGTAQVNLAPVAAGGGLAASQVRELFLGAWQAGLKGLTVFAQVGRDPVLTADEARTGCNREACAD